jgi:hypothetical protein
MIYFHIYACIYICSQMYIFMQNMIDYNCGTVWGEEREEENKMLEGEQYIKILELWMKVA